MSKAERTPKEDPALFEFWEKRFRENFTPWDAGGPPFGLKAGELSVLLGEGLEQTVDAAVGDSIPIFAGKERWQVWVKR